MALFSLCNTFSVRRTLKMVYSEFHTLRKMESFSFVQRNSAPSITPKRNLFWIFKKRTKRELRAKDKPPDQYELIYRNGVDHYFLVGQYGTFFMSATVTFGVLYSWDRWVDTRTMPLERDRPRPVNDQALGVYSCFIFTVCMFYFFLARLPMRIYYYPQKQKYLMCFYGPVPNQIKKQTLKVADIKAMPDKGTMPWSHAIFQHTSGQKLMLFENYFRNPADLYIMLGLQKDPHVEGYDKVEDRK